MNSSELSASIAHLDSMLNRVEKVIGRERKPKPLRPDVSYPRRAKPKPRTPAIASNCQQSPQRLRGSTGYSQVIASGELAGNEMRLGDYKPQPRDDDPTGMWATFEADFDEMVAGMH